MEDEMENMNNKPAQEKCQRQLYRGTYHSSPCKRNVWKDGYCRIHHPETVAARHAKREARWEEEKKQSAWYKLEQAEKRIAELEGDVKAMVEWLEKNQPDVFQRGIWSAL
jgi:hypothetical protein